jgi:Apea-like HEPN
VTGPLLVEQFPLYGCLTGFTLPVENFEIGPGLLLRKTFATTLSTRLVSVSVPPSPPGSSFFSAIRDAGTTHFTSEARVELAITKSVHPNFTSPRATAWLVASLLRLQLDTPVRMTVLANTPFNSMADCSQAVAVAFEAEQEQWGNFPVGSVQVAIEELLRIRRCLPVAARLSQEERFLRAYSIYDDALWAPRKELAAVLLWTALEILFDASGEQNKTRALSGFVSKWIGYDRAERDRAYNVIRELYHKRGRVVHTGEVIEPADLTHSLQICRAVFEKVLVRERLPPPRLRLVD